MLAGRAAHVFRTYTTLPQSSSTPACLAPEPPADLPAEGNAAPQASLQPAQTCSCTLLARRSVRQSIALDRRTSCALRPSLPAVSTNPKSLPAAPAPRCSDRAGSILCKWPAALVVQAGGRRQGRCRRHHFAAPARQKDCRRAVAQG